MRQHVFHATGVGTSHTDGAHGGAVGLDEQFGAPQTEKGSQSPKVMQHMSKGIPESRLDGHPSKNAYGRKAFPLLLL